MLTDLSMRLRLVNMIFYCNAIVIYKLYINIITANVNRDERSASQYNEMNKKIKSSRATLIKLTHLDSYRAACVCFTSLHSRDNNDD